MQVRKSCVVCGGETLNDMYTMEQFPLYTYSTLDPAETDEFGDITFAACESCTTVQLKKLVDPVKLYGTSHNLTFATPTWAKHHREFAEFILNTSETEKPILEIGGSSGILAKEILAQGAVPYSILDLCNAPPDCSGVTFIHGNCEVYDFPKDTIVVLSHVFEHLYEPRKFLQRLKECGVRTVYISNPNMHAWLETKVLSFLHVEHTFYCDTDVLNYLFNSFGYRSTDVKEFQTHSIFYRFELGSESLDVNLPYRPSLVKQFQEYLEERENRFKSLTLPKSIYIFPAGHYGQLANYFLCGKTNVEGFFDNDVSKQEKRVYGCKTLTWSPTCLSAVEKFPILLCATVYKDEIKNQLTKLYGNLDFIDI